jgi:DNA-directed RNA polymerase I subunit RPA12
VQTITEEDMDTYAVVDQQCAKCGREQVKFYTQQLRSADEGSTVFYVCDCGNKCVPLSLCIDSANRYPYRWNENN